MESNLYIPQDRQNKVKKKRKGRKRRKRKGNNKRRGEIGEEKGGRGSEGCHELPISLFSPEIIHQPRDLIVSAIF